MDETIRNQIKALNTRVKGVNALQPQERLDELNNIIELYRGLLSRTKNVTRKVKRNILSTTLKKKLRNTIIKKSVANLSVRAKGRKYDIILESINRFHNVLTECITNINATDSIFKGKLLKLLNSLEGVRKQLSRP
jgi:uncharacterized protein (DUF488 family)